MPFPADFVTISPDTAVRHLFRLFISNVFNMPNIFTNILFSIYITSKNKGMQQSFLQNQQGKYAE